MKKKVDSLKLFKEQYMSVDEALEIYSEISRERLRYLLRRRNENGIGEFSFKIGTKIYIDRAKFKKFASLALN